MQDFHFTFSLMSSIKFYGHGFSIFKTHRTSVMCWLDIKSAEQQMVWWGGSLERHHSQVKVLSGNRKSRSSFILFHDPVWVRPIHKTREAKALKHRRRGDIKRVCRYRLWSRARGLASLRPEGSSRGTRVSECPRWPECRDLSPSLRTDYLLIKWWVICNNGLFLHAILGIKYINTLRAWIIVSAP